MSQSLDASELDSWKDSTLLRIDKINDDSDRKPIHLENKTCSIRGFIHALRVLPDLTSAREVTHFENEQAIQKIVKILWY